MNIPKIALSVGHIDDDLIASATRQKQYIKPVFKWGLFAACFCLCILLTIILMPSNITPPIDDPSQDGGTDGKINVSDNLIIIGEEHILTDDEGYTFLQSHKDAIIKDLRISGVAVSNITFTKGYTPVRTGDSGNSVAVNWRTYLAFDGEDLVAIIEMSKDEQGLHYGLAFGGLGFAYYAQLLDAYRGEELVFLYIGEVVAFVTPDDEVVPVADLDLTDVVEPDYPYYQYFKTPYNTFIP